MGTIVPFPQPEPYWESCSVCRRYDVCLNVGREHWFVCHRHRTKWCIGINLFSGWEHEDASVWACNAAVLAGYRAVEPFIPVQAPPPASEAEALQHEVEIRERLLAEREDADPTLLGLVREELGLLRCRLSRVRREMS